MSPQFCINISFRFWENLAALRICLFSIVFALSVQGINAAVAVTHGASLGLVREVLYIRGGDGLTLWPCRTVPKTTRRLCVCAEAEQRLYCVGSFTRNCIVLPEKKFVTSDPWRDPAV